MYVLEVMYCTCMYVCMYSVNDILDRFRVDNSIGFEGLDFYVCMYVCMYV